jgi:hypothetical protein
VRVADVAVLELEYVAAALVVGHQLEHEVALAQHRRLDPGTGIARQHPKRLAHEDRAVDFFQADDAAVEVQRTVEVADRQSHVSEIGQLRLAQQIAPQDSSWLIAELGPSRLQHFAQHTYVIFFDVELNHHLLLLETRARLSRARSTAAAHSRGTSRPNPA